MSRETPILSRKRKGDTHYNYAGNLLLNQTIISASPRHSSVRSVKALETNKSALTSRKGEDWTKPRKIEDSDNGKKSDNFFSRAGKAYVKAYSLVQRTVFGKPEEDHNQELEPSQPQLDTKGHSPKKQKTSLQSENTQLKKELDTLVFSPNKNPVKDDLIFNQSPIDWSKNLASSTNNNGNKDNYGTHFLVRKNKYKDSTPTAKYLQYVHKGTYTPPTASRTSASPTPSLSTASSSRTSSSLHKRTSLLNSFQQLADALSTKLNQLGTTMKTKDDDVIFLKERKIEQTHLRYSLRFNDTGLTFKNEYDYYQKKLKEKEQVKETAHQERIKAESAPKSSVTEEDEKRLKDIWKSKGRDQHKLLTAFNIDVKVMDFKTLADGRWLNDVIIEVYSKLLNNDKIFSFNSYFYTTIQEKGYIGVKKWMKRAKQDISKLDMVICPINVHGTHWVLGVIDIKNKKILYMDSFANSPNSFSQRALKDLNTYVQEESVKQGYPEIGKGFELIHCESPQQNNGYDCGVFTLLNAKRISEGKALDYPSNYPTQFRREIAAKILSMAPKKSSL